MIYKDFIAETAQKLMATEIISFDSSEMTPDNKELNVLAKGCIAAAKVSATLFLYDRQYCEHEDYSAPAIDPLGWTSGGPLLCFDDFFEEVHDRRGGVWHPEPEPSGLKPLTLNPMDKKELEELSKKVLGDKAEKPMVLCTDMPRPMNYDRWLHECLNFPNRPREIHIPKEKLNVVARFLNQHLHDLPPIYPDELKELGVIIKAE